MKANRKLIRGAQLRWPLTRESCKSYRSVAMASCPDDTTEISRLELLQNLTDRSAICETEPQDDFKRKQHCGCGGFGI